jgi:hypothetical protein
MPSNRFVLFVVVVAVVAVLVVLFQEEKIFTIPSSAKQTVKLVKLLHAQRSTTDDSTDF